MPRLLRTHNVSASRKHPPGLIVLRRLKALRMLRLSFFPFFLLKNFFGRAVEKRAEIKFLLKYFKMEITGRLTADAVVRTVKQDKKVVGFTLALNDSYRSGDERKEITTYIECGYWRNEGIAEYLKKGGLVQVYGRIGVNAYMSGNNEAKATLTFHVSEIKLFGGGSLSVPSDKKINAGQTVQAVKEEGIDDIVGDLPF
jgi:single-strand DNA-binding protein